ncbi:MAG TPA: PadR family transcriptional regulator [Anaerolineae bacterium]|nr:PadR family transcriptional regulator [Anaerolineae bacterium]
MSLLQDAILALLAQQPSYGYELHQAFHAVMGGAQNWDLKPAQVYRTLNQLEKKQFISSIDSSQDGGPVKTTYAITPVGQEALQNWFLTPVTTDHRRDEVFLKLMLTLYLPHIDPLKVIYTQRTHLYRELHQVTAHRHELNPRTDLAHLLLLDQALMHLEADLRWLEMVEARLDDILAQPLPQPESRPQGRPPTDS